MKTRSSVLAWGAPTICLAVLLLCVLLPCAAAAQGPIFSIRLEPGLVESPVSGRLLLFMTAAPGSPEVLSPDFFNPGRVWIAAAELTRLEPQEPAKINPDLLAFPAPFSTAPAGEYRVMALLDSNHSYAYDGMGEGDLRSKVLTLSRLASSEVPAATLTLSERVPARPLKDSDSIKQVTFQSPALSAFWGRPVLMRAGVVLPPARAGSKSHRYPTSYNVHGYGGSHSIAWQVGPGQVNDMTEGRLPEMVYVYLDGSGSMGHHEFADSVNNGPWGYALTRELIPYLESKFPMDASPASRLLTGHSSGGWSTLWLQINYPELFGGTWSTAPDPVDFRSFTGPDLTRTPPQNFYYGSDGKPYNLVRFRGREIMTLREFALQERVLGCFGGQFASFEAVFSLRGPDGRPMPLFDRDTGRIDAAVQKAWESYDIARILRARWPQSGSKLRGKIHVIVGTEDTFHLEQGAYLLRDVLKELGSDATFEFIEGRDHFDLYRDGLDARIAREMYETARPARKVSSLRPETPRPPRQTRPAGRRMENDRRSQSPETSSA